MQILSIKRPNGGKPLNGLKIYATVQGDEHNGVTKEYKVGYFRRPSFRGWMCSCENFVLTQFGKGGHCKHIDLITEQYGRYGAAVLPSKQRPKLALVLGGVVFVTQKANSIWTGKGVVVKVHDKGFVSLKMSTGRMIGETGAFSSKELGPVPENYDAEQAAEAALPTGPGSTENPIA